MKRTALILEGGGNRGIFTAGVLDLLMEQGVTFSYVVGVSAGACNAVDYLSHQPERTKNCMIPKEGDGGSRLEWKEALKKRSLFDMDKIFDEYPKTVYPFDFETYKASPMKCEIVVTNCLTGKAEYLDERQDPERLMKLCRASASLPVVSPVTWLDEVPYMDGGIADSIPLRRALESGYKRCVVVTTRNKGYRKKASPMMLRVSRHMYSRYPEFVETMRNRVYVYNKTMELLERLESRGHVFVIRPKVPVISKAETDVELLEGFYRHGYAVMKERLSDMEQFLRR